MSTITTKAAAKVAAVATGLGMATSLLALAPSAHAAALTQSQIDSIISLLQSFGADAATIANVQTSLSGGTPAPSGTTSGSCAFTMDLHTGSSGAQVTCLQQALIAAGYAIPAGATGYFGSQTQAAVSAWQTASGVSPAAGYFGPISRAAWNLGGTTTGGGTAGLPAGCTSTSGYSSTTGQPCSSGTTTTTLTGAGRLTDESSLGDVTTTFYANGATAAIIGDSFKATDGDVQLQRVDATFDLASVTTGSTNLDQYFKDVQLWVGDTMLATMSASAGDESSSVWTYRFTGLNHVVKSGESVKIYVKVTPVASIGNNQDSSGSFAGTATAKLLANAVRAVGADGISDTYVATAITQNYTVSSAVTGTLTMSPASDNPAASQLLTSSSTKTGVKLLSFNAKAKNSDVKVKNLRIHLTTSDNNLSDVVSTVFLMKGSTVLKSSTLSTGTDQSVTFSNVDDTVAKGTTTNYTIVVDIKGQNTAYVDGTTLVASTTTAGWSVTDALGNSVTPSSAVSGNTMTLTGNGFTITAGTPTADGNKTAGYSGALTTASFTIPFTVTAGDTAIYVLGKTTATTSTSGKTATTGFGSQAGVVYATTTTSTATTTAASTASLTASGTDSNDTNVTTTGGYYVAANSSRTFTLNISTGATANNTPGSNVLIGYQLVGINYDTTSTMGSTYYTSNLNSYKTTDVAVQKGA